MYMTRVCAARHALRPEVHIKSKMNRRAPVGPRVGPSLVGPRVGPSLVGPCLFDESIVDEPYRDQTFAFFFPSESLFIKSLAKFTSAAVSAIQ